MHHDYPTSKKSLALGACAIAAAVLFGSGFLPASASAADFFHGTLKGSNIYGCFDLMHYLDTAHHFDDEGKKEGKKSLDEHIKEGTCKMLQKGLKATVTHVHSEHDAMKARIEGESKELWISSLHFKHN